MSNELVAYSRQGDVFHYRWAARRCLKLVFPNTTLETIVIEGSKEKIKRGEYVIDITEYYNDESSKQNEIKYYQLKHTTVQKDNPFTLSDLKETIEGFSQRFSQHIKESKNNNFSFTIVTNRPIKDSFKNNVYSLANGKQVGKVFKQTIEKYTKLSSVELNFFCKHLTFQDREGDYKSQKDELRFETAQLIAGAVDNAQVENVVSLIQDKVTDIKNKSICREDILERFHISSEKDLFPAPPKWEHVDNIIEREQHNKLKSEILNASHPVIVHASGGVGKSVFCRQLAASIPIDSITIAYDCFGAGSYRNRSESRHRHRDALVQIANELAVKGLCDPLLVQDTSLDSDIMKKFLWRIEASVKTLKQTSDTAALFIFIDAADNAEMAAFEYSQPCFVSELIQENIPEGCKLVFLCRSERIQLLKPSSKIVQLELEPFSEEESLLNLRKWFPKASKTDGEEFHRLTSKNPRVQANALSVKASTIAEILIRLGPDGKTVEEQIELQLKTAVSKINDSLSDPYQQEIQEICIGLASLPPHIPIEILAEVAGVKVEMIRSFVSDIGRSLWVSEESIQFRDEPTETWFRKTYLAKEADFENYINKLEPLANKHSYVAEVLPHLYLHAKKYKKLIKIALSDKYIPNENPIEARNVRVYRLQFAFRAALRTKNYDDAVKIAMRAGEEMAGNQRQLELFQSNIDLLVLLQNKQKVQDIAFKRILKSDWNGSENVYTASLLSGINEFKGEARSYGRAAINWLRIYYDELRKSKEDYLENKVSQSDILEIAFTLFNINGVKDCIDFLNGFNSEEYASGILQNLIGRLIDIGNYLAVDNFLKHCTNQPYFVIAITSELLKICKFPDKEIIESCLDLLLIPEQRIGKPEHFDYEYKHMTSILSFIEVCLAKNLSNEKILEVIKLYFPEKASRSLSGSHQYAERAVFIKALAVRTLLEKRSEVDINSILPDDLAEIKKNKNYEYNSDLKNFKQVINGLFPWFFLRVKILSGQLISFKDAVQKANEESNKARSDRYVQYDTLPNEIATIQSSILTLCNKSNGSEVNWFYKSYIKNNKSLWIPNQIQTVRAAFKLSHLESIKHDLEQDAYERIKNINDDGPEQAAERYIDLARAVLNTAKEDSSVYFEEAINIVSKFGDEIVCRWDAVVALAEHASSKHDVPDKLAYRFIRCAELVGENVDREKYWNRSKAMAVCARMSGGVGISALSRWRDRHIGRFEYQLEALLIELMQSHKISASIGWSFSRYLSYDHLRLLVACLENENSTEIKQTIFADAVHLIQIEGTTLEYWDKMHQIASEQKIQDSTLDKILAYYEKNVKSSSEKKEVKYVSTSEVNNDLNWAEIFGNADILKSDGFNKCFLVFNALSRKQRYRNIESFWDKVIQRIFEKDLRKFIDILFLSDLKIYDFKSFFKALPIEWKNKISFKKNWPLIIKQIGRKYAQELVNRYSYKHLLDDLNIKPNEYDGLKEGIIEGLANGYEFSKAEMFFEFVNLIAPKIKPKKAEDLLKFALSRFELHIEKDFGDGKWHESLYISQNTNKNIAGFIWSTLGSPRSVERWNAAHTVRILAELNCVDIINELISWMLHDKVDAFGFYKFPFYNLHARLYLLIAFARISINKPEILIQHKDIFAQYALGKPHILIQKFSAGIAINLSFHLKDIYDEETLNKLRTTGKSKLPTVKKNSNKRTDSYWHNNNEVETEYDFHFGWDFNQYWFDPLGRVFGVPGKQVEDIAANVIVKDWGITDKGGYNNDPRVSIWNRNPYERETRHSHGSYPRTDNLDFYLSYHSMLAAAAKLLEKMPTVSKYDWDWDEESWEDWLKRHLLTCSNGKWLIDYRDPVPLKRPDWIAENNDDDWRTNVTEKDFIDTLNLNDMDGKWIIVKGGWQETHSSRTESYSVNSALVSKNTANSLMRALESCDNPYNCPLPDYSEEEWEINTDIFKLKGWLKYESVSKGLDEYDRFADNIDFLPYSIGNDIIQKLGLEIKNNGKTYYSPLTTSPSLKCNIWSTYRNDTDENADQAGMILQASIRFLQDLCSAYKCDLIFDVKIERDINTGIRKKNTNI